MPCSRTHSSGSTIVDSTTRDDLYSLHRLLTQDVLEIGGPDSGCEDAIQAWEQRNQRALERYLAILDNIKACRSYNTTTLPVALREVRNVIRGVVGAGAQAPR
jgi:NAD-specific glutamate dehydrogenase